MMPLAQVVRMARVLNDVEDERERQHKLFKEGKHSVDVSSPETSVYYSLGVLGEEFGEVCKEAIELRFDHTLYDELVQVAAVAVAMAESLLAK